MTDVDNTRRFVRFASFILFGCSLAAALVLYAVTNRYVLIQNQPTLRLLDRLTGQVSEWIVIDEKVTVDPLAQLSDSVLKNQVVAARRTAEEARRKVAAQSQSALDRVFGPRLDALKGAVSQEDLDLVRRYEPYEARRVASGWVTLGPRYHSEVQAVRGQAQVTRVRDER